MRVDELVYLLKNTIQSPFNFINNLEKVKLTRLRLNDTYIRVANVFFFMNLRKNTTKQKYPHLYKNDDSFICVNLIYARN